MKWTPEELAKKFHELYERLAPNFGYETRKESAVAWENVPVKNKALMTEVCAHILTELEEDHRKEIESWIRYKQNIDEALNSGDGVYRP